MSGETKNDWRDLVYAYLQAYRDDMRTRLEIGLSGAEVEFLREHGTGHIRQAHDRAARARCDGLGEPPPKESYEVVEESSHRVLVQLGHPKRTDPVLPPKHPIPYYTARFLLIKEEAEWKIAGIYYPCISCNFHARADGVPSREVGKCFFCDGTGKSRVPRVQTRGLWVFKRRRFSAEPCKYCGATGNCAKCASEAMPGWNIAFSLDGLTEAKAEAEPQAGAPST
jgi:hypothetical protein